MRQRILVKSSISLRVRLSVCPLLLSLSHCCMSSDGGWLSKNEIPAGKGSFATFDKLAQENKRIIRGIIEPSEDDNAQVDVVDYDKQNLKKLQDLYASCINEDLLTERGMEPLEDVVNSIRSLYRQNSWKLTSQDNNRDEEEDAIKDSDYGLTAAISFMHSRGKCH